MNKVALFFKTVSPKILLIICIIIGLLAKLIESKLPDVAMGLQLITFGLLLFAINKFFNSRRK
jgi:uncharacterized membrane protein YvlD (DUF360 family)